MEDTDIIMKEDDPRYSITNIDARAGNTYDSNSCQPKSILPGWIMSDWIGREEDLGPLG